MRRHRSRDENAGEERAVIVRGRGAFEPFVHPNPNQVSG